MGAAPRGQARSRSVEEPAANPPYTWSVSATETTPDTIDLTEPFLIGDVEIANRVIVAPMAGVSVQAFRRQGKRFGAGLVCSEMVSACGLTYKNERTLGYLRIASDEHPLAVQVFGSDPTACADAARTCVAAGADIVDLNMGCPVRKVTKTSSGASLLEDADLACRITAAVAEAVSVPVTVKLRRGVRNGSRSALELGPRLVDVGAMALTLHPRSAVQMYTGEADHALTAELVSLVDVPVFASGDITSRARAQAVLATTGATAVMIGRGVQGNPWLLRELLVGHAEVPTDDELAAEIVRFVREVSRELGPERAVGWLRKFYGWYLRGGRLGSHMRSALATSKSVDEVEQLLVSAAPGAVELIERSDREIAALGDIEDDSYLDLPISIYAGG
jgi:tRNA-dihydrouridine synthase B